MWLLKNYALATNYGWMVWTANAIRHLLILRNLWPCCSSSSMDVPAYARCVYQMQRVACTASANQLSSPRRCVTTTCGIAEMAEERALMRAMQPLTGPNAQAMFAWSQKIQHNIGLRQGRGLVISDHLQPSITPQWLSLSFSSSRSTVPGKIFD